jgi:hypothetical protein
MDWVFEVDLDFIWFSGISLASFLVFSLAVFLLVLLILLWLALVFVW